MSAERILEDAILCGSWCDYEDVVIVRDGSTYLPLTPCCEAVATGSIGVTACRACYEEVDDVFGICWNGDAAFLKAIADGAVRTPS